MWTHARITGYILTFFTGIAFLATAIGVGTYDAGTWLFDLHPVDVKWLAGVVAGPVASGIAAVAAWRGWGRK